MQKILGIKIGKYEIFFSLMEKDNNTCVLVDNGKIAILQRQKVPELMATIKREISGLIEKYPEISKVIYHMSYDCRKDGILQKILPLGVLNLCCHYSGIEAEGKTMMNITPKRFNNIPKG